MAISGTTRFLALLGHPVAQVRSLGPINQWFAENGIDAAIFPIDIEASGIAAFLEAMRASDNCIGFSVTVPHKQIVARHVDELTERAQTLGLVNIVRRERDGRLVGDMGDGISMTAALIKNGVELRGAHAVVVGAGGAGLAILHALGEAGAASLTILEIDATRREIALDSLSRRFPGITLSFSAPDNATIDIVINASTLGMRPDDPHPFPIERLNGVKIIADAVTKPALTPWLVAAVERGHKIQRGEEMTFAQVPLQLRFLGFEASV